MWCDVVAAPLKADNLGLKQERKKVYEQNDKKKKKNKTTTKKQIVQV